MATNEEYGNFLNEVLNATFNSDNDPREVYPLLQANLNKLDDNLAQVLRDGTKARFSQVEPDEAEDMAVVIGNFSIMLRDFPHGNRASNLEIAITGFEIVTTVFTYQVFPEEWAVTQGHLGNAYYYRIQGDRAENLEMAIRYYSANLEVFTYETFPFHWAKTQKNLGLVYCKRIPKKREENLETAIHCFLKALKVYNRRTSSKDWGSTKSDLGAAYVDRIRGEKAKNLEEAIFCLSEALEVRTRETFPLEWADTQNNLGLAYFYRIRGEKAKNLEEAIFCLLKALEIRTRESFPLEWADTQNNLGNAYLYRIRGESAENLEEAIRYLSEALEVHTREAFPEKWAMVQHNLGTAYSNRIEGEQTENLEAAICFYLAALEVRTRETAPFDWAVTQDNLGIAYRNRIQGDRAENLEAAIRCYLDALEVRTPEAFPEKWAGTQNNLGNAYLERIQGDRAENLEAAIRCFSDALKVVFTHEAFPQSYILTQFNLGLAYQNARQFRNAKTAFASAIEIIESQRGEIVCGSGREEDKQKLAEQWNQVYQNIVKVCLELHEIAPAIEYVERSKVRNLVELIVTRDFHSIFPSEIVSQLEQLGDEIANGQYLLQTATTDNSATIAQYLQQLRQQRKDLQDRYLPLGSGFQFDQFQSTIRDRTAIVEFYIASDKLLVFIVTKETQKPIVLPPDLIDPKKLANWANSYLKAYINKNSHWQRRLTTRLHLLAKILHVDEIIQQIPTECDKLILIPHRYLHLVSLHALPINSEAGKSKPQFLMDRFPKGVRYAPSCQLLQLAKTRKRPNFTHLFAIQNPTDDLTYADLEVAAIQSYFDSTSILEKDAATKAALDDTPLNTFHCVHFSCHGYFNSNPSLANKSALILADAELDSSLIEFDSERHLLLTGGKVLELDKCLTLDAIFSLKFQLGQCRLVVLSACETGLIDFRNTSDEYIGLVSGFLFAGSPSVVSSLWAVDEISTAFLFIKFYENLKSYPKLGEGDVAMALQDAQNWLRNLTSEKGKQFLDKIKPHIEKIFKEPILAELFLDGALTRINAPIPYPFFHPYNWAAFTATGF
ncbi:CHAT domain-containing protein [Microcoleus sp. D3_18_C4]|uniref:CHAT domain-containing protein n=1 Tax=Microcoleus sp. D3_18_C4 TaxID=3055335 RepID=UPI002FD4A4B7